MDDCSAEDHLTKRLSISLAMLACSVASAADFRPLDVKTGEWETTMTGQTSGMPPIPADVLNRLTPDQRAKMEAAMQARGMGGPKTSVNKSCLTKDKLDKPFSTGDDSTKACTRTLITSSGSRQEIRIECNREGMKSTGTVKVEALDAHNVKGSMVMAVTSGEHTMTMNYTFTTKWLGAACTEK
jgi:hypothetical protein